MTQQIVDNVHAAVQRMDEQSGHDALVRQLIVGSWSRQDAEILAAVKRGADRDGRPLM